MKFVKFIIFPLLLSVFANAALSEKQVDYKDSCQKTALRFFTDSKEFADNNKMILSAIMVCKEIMSDLDAGKKWSLVKDPKFNGCSDVVRLLIPKGSDDKFEKSQRAKYCAQYLNL